MYDDGMANEVYSWYRDAYGALHILWSHMEDCGDWIRLLLNQEGHKGALWVHVPLDIISHQMATLRSLHFTIHHVDIPREHMVLYRWNDPTMENKVPPHATSTQTVGALILSPDEQHVLLVHEYGHWKVVTGTMHGKESILDAAKREAMEEVAVTCDPKYTSQLVHVMHRPGGGGCHNVTTSLPFYHQHRNHQSSIMRRIMYHTVMSHSPASSTMLRKDTLPVDSHIYTSNNDSIPKMAKKDAHSRLARTLFQTPSSHTTTTTTHDDDHTRNDMAEHLWIVTLRATSYHMEPDGVEICHAQWFHIDALPIHYKDLISTNVPKEDVTVAATHHDKDVLSRGTNHNKIHCKMDVHTKQALITWKCGKGWTLSQQ